MTNQFDFDPDRDDLDTDLPEFDDAATDRSLARRVALQVLYEVDSTQHPPDLVIGGRLAAQPRSRKVRSYINRLVAGVLKHQQMLDEVIQLYAPEWPLNQIAIIDRNILRMALFELGIEDRTPVVVAIDEAVDLARVFGADASPRFINGVLAALALELDTVRERLRDGTPPQEDEEPPL